jgi:hypothetical protein
MIITRHKGRKKKRKEKEREKPVERTRGVETVDR